MDAEKYSLQDIRRIQGQILDWRVIQRAYMIRPEFGIKLVETKGERCGLCPRYRSMTINMATGDQFASCRRCPIVKATGRTCLHWRLEHGEPPDWYKNPIRAIVDVAIIIRRLELVLAKMKGS